MEKGVLVELAHQKLYVYEDGTLTKLCVFTGLDEGGYNTLVFNESEAEAVLLQPKVWTRRPQLGEVQQGIFVSQHPI